MNTAKALGSYQPRISHIPLQTTHHSLQSFTHRGRPLQYSRLTRPSFWQNQLQWHQYSTTRPLYKEGGIFSKIGSVFKKVIGKEEKKEEPKEEPKVVKEEAKPPKPEIQQPKVFKFI